MLLLGDVQFLAMTAASGKCMIIALATKNKQFTQEIAEIEQQKISI